MTTISPEVYRSMGLRDSEYEEIVRLLGREPRLTEVGMFAVMWSEHCGYKYSRPVLKYFSRYKEAMEGEGHENAGIVDIGDNLGVVMKIESHNHPSAVEPYQGAATGVGGIIRDIFTMGARPIAALNSLRFGPITSGEVDSDTASHNRFLFNGVVRGIGGYGNCVGVPTIGGEVAFHPRYTGRPLVNAMCVGMVELDQIATAGAQGVGNPVIYLGSATGKDGIHGATFASEELEDENEAKRPNVQIGDPFAEKLLIEATLEALKTGAIQSIQDMGAAGLTCSTIEMSAKGGVGMSVDLDLVPMRESNMSGYELMLSESQERMLAVAHKGREQEVIDVFQKWGVHAVVIGRVTDDDLVTVTRHGEIVAQVKADHLADTCPTYTTEPQVPAYYEEAKAFSTAGLPEVEHNEALKTLAQSPTLASKKWVYQQYDHQVQTQTSLVPGDGDAAVLAPRGTKKGLSVKVDCNGRQVYLDPYVGGQLVVAEAARNVACTGAKPVAVTDGLNYGNPEIPHVYWQFERSVRGIADACETMKTPVISGNVSFYNQGVLGEVLPTPMIGMLGLMEDANNRIGQQVPKAGLTLALLRYDLPEVPQDGLGASAYLAEVHDKETGVPVPPLMEKEYALCEVLTQLAAEQIIRSAHDVSEGGLAFCLAECFGNGIGAKVELPETLASVTESESGICYGEFPGWVVVSLPENLVSRLGQICGEEGILYEVIGQSEMSDRLELWWKNRACVSVSIGDFRAWHGSCLNSIMNE
ncbi:MAG: phosphoribosylformylglycinamidine synthase subunit PurL [Fimbriimonadaceae bacterium]